MFKIPCPKEIHTPNRSRTAGYFQQMNSTTENKKKCKFKEIIDVLESYEEGVEPRTNAIDLGE